MDSQVARDGRLMELVDEKWRDDKLPMEEVAVPQMELPEIEPDNGPTNETLKEQEQKWSDLALSALHDQPPATTNNWLMVIYINLADVGRDAIYTSTVKSAWIIFVKIIDPKDWKNCSHVSSSRQVAIHIGNRFKFCWSLHVP